MKLPRNFVSHFPSIETTFNNFFQPSYLFKNHTIRWGCVLKNNFCAHSRILLSQVNSFIEVPTDSISRLRELEKRKVDVCNKIWKSIILEIDIKKLDFSQKVQLYEILCNNKPPCIHNNVLQEIFRSLMILPDDFFKPERSLQLLFNCMKLGLQYTNQLHHLINRFGTIWFNSIEKLHDEDKIIFLLGISIFMRDKIHSSESSYDFNSTLQYFFHKEASTLLQLYEFLLKQFLNETIQSEMHLSILFCSLGHFISSFHGAENEHESSLDKIERLKSKTKLLNPNNIDKLNLKDRNLNILLTINSEDLLKSLEKAKRLPKFDKSTHTYRYMIGIDWCWRRINDLTPCLDLPRFNKLQEKIEISKDLRWKSNFQFLEMTRIYTSPWNRQILNDACNYIDRMSKEQRTSAKEYLDNSLIWLKHNKNECTEYDMNPLYKQISKFSILERKNRSNISWHQNRFIV